MAITFYLNHLMLIDPNEGLVALLPSAGHDAYLAVGNGAFTAALRGANVTLTQDGIVMLASNSCAITKSNWMVSASAILTSQGVPNGPFQMRRELVESSVWTQPELNARIVLPDGQLEFEQPNGDAVQWEFPIAKTLASPTDVATLIVDTDQHSSYAIQIHTESGIQLIPIPATANIVIGNADRPTRNNRTHPWYEITHIFDLLDLPQIDYPIPAQTFSTKKTPFVSPCPPMTV